MSLHESATVSIHPASLEIEDTTEDTTSLETRQSREQANAAAIGLALRLEADGRTPTLLERTVLLGYTGVGGTNTSSEIEDGNTLGLLNEYYTPLPIARAIWTILKRLGFNGGHALEPASGIGVFLETAPPTVSFTAVELNPDAARINRLLHPQASVRVMSFEHDHRRTDELEFDLVIGNPPFGPRGMNAVEDKPHRKDYPRYFLDAALDRLRDGGLLAFVIPSGLTDAAKHQSFRAFLLARTRVRALVRLPVGTFGRSGARVATDILVLEKRPWVVGDTLTDLVWQFDARVLASAGLVDAATRDYLRGEFFDAQPEHLLGELVVDRRWGNLVCDGPLDQAALERLAQTPLLESPNGPVTLGALLSVLEKRESFAQLAAECQSTVRELLEASWARARSEGHPHADGATRADGQTFRISKRDGRWIRAWHAPAPLHPTLQAALEVAEALSEFHRARGPKTDPGLLEQQRIVALERLQSFIAGHGNPHACLLVTTMARSKPALYRLLGAIRPDGAISPQLLAPSITIINRSTDLETTCQALDAARRLTIHTLLEHWQGGTLNAARAFLLESDDWMLTPDGRFTASTNHARGDVLEKAALARAQAEHETDVGLVEKLLRQAVQLEALKPRRTLEEIDLAGNEAWIPTTLIQAWLEEAYPHLEYTRDPQNGRVTIGIESERFKLTKITKAQAEEDQKTLSRFFNLEHTAKVVNDAQKLSSEEYASKRKARIEEAQERERALGLKFRHFIGADLDLRSQLEDCYNALYNNFVSGEDDLSPLTLPGWAKPVPHGHQNHGTRFTLERANALIAFDTGLGKTILGVSIAESWLEQARAERVMIVVPKGLLVNWQRTLERAVPFRRVLTVGISPRALSPNVPAQQEATHIEDELATVLEKLHAFALGAFEIALISREWFRRLRLRPEHLRHFIQHEAAMLAADEVESEDENTEREKTLTLAERQSLLASRLDQTNALPQIHFEDLKIDALIVDEAGSLKNLYAAPSFFGRKPKFMGASLESDRAIDTLFKVKQLHGTNASRNVVFLTATPTKNSPLELFNILKPLAGETFTRLGIYGPAQFVERYCQIETVLYPNAAGVLEAVPGVVGFKNLQELRGLMAQFVLHRTAEDVGLKIPDLETVEHVFDLGNQQRAVYQQLRLAAKIALEDPHGDHGIHLFAVYAQMRLVTLEPRLYSPSFDGNPRFREAARIALETLKTGGKLVCFMDLGNASAEDARGRRKKKLGPDAFELLKAELVHAGVPAEWIAIITADRVKGSRRQAIADEYNLGKLRVILGSTGTIGEGFDLQVGTTDLVHLDIPWDPGTFHQRVGRGHRQGNTASRVRNHILLARGSFDGLTYAMMRGKRGWQEQLWRSSEDRTRNSAVLSYDEILAALSEDPDAARLEIERQRSNIEAGKLAERRRMALAQFRVYLETLDHQTLAWQKAMGRKHGPTANDHKLKANFEVQLERYRQGLRDLPAFVHHDLLDGRPCLITSGGVVLGAGVTFGLEHDGQTIEYRVEAVGFRSTGDGKWVKAIPLEDEAVRVFQERELETVHITS